MVVHARGTRPFAVVGLRKNAVRGCGGVKDWERGLLAGMVGFFDLCICKRPKRVVFGFFIFFYPEQVSTSDIDVYNPWDWLETGKNVIKLVSLFLPLLGPLT